MQQHLPLISAGVIAHGPLAGLFHPAVADWFTDTFGSPTEVQQRAWQATARHRNTLITAPTGSGKTLAAFLAAINDLVVEGIERGLEDQVHVLYVSPLKALSNDIQKNLQAPLAGIRERVRALGLGELEIRDAVRTGDTPQAERERMRRLPPHILVTTPESLFILLTSDSGRDMLRRVRTVIVDELHAVAGGKRGAHLALTLERLDALCAQAPVRIGLSATQKPIELMARLLVGERAADAAPAADGAASRFDCEIVDTGHNRQRDLALEIPRSPLSAVMATEVWTEVYDRLAELVGQHRTTLIFVNQRRQAERAARFLAERLGEEAVTAHHGSLAREHRLDAEQRLKSGKLRALVATASLELGIDIGDVDLVCQLGSPRSINAFLQRVGRAGHAVRAIPKGRLFPLSLDDLAECAALLRCANEGELDRIAIPQAPLDVLAQQIVAEISLREWGVDELYHCLRRALPFRGLTLARFEEVVHMLADGYSTRRGRRGALLHYDAVNRRLRGRRGAKLTAVTNAGVIPDQFDYEVELAPEGLRIGTLNEDFAFESLPGDIVQLGNTSYRILKVETGRVIVEDARGQPPNMPFWLGEGLGRSAELSLAVSRLREEADAILGSPHAGEGLHNIDACAAWLQRAYALAPAAALQLAHYLAAARAALGLLPTRNRLVFERFFDEVGDTHLVIHAPLGSRINRAWGLALRKRFCKQFNFELQAAALDDSLVLSLGPTHSFPLEDVRQFLHSNSALEVLTQAVLQAPMFATRWRWAASVALAVARNRGGKRVPPQWQRADAEDLLTHAFPDAVACQDNLPGHREIPEHPLVQQAMDDCLHEVMDAEGMLALLRRIESGAVAIVCRDLTAPSPLSESILNARPYAFLDDGAAEERRTRAVKTRGPQPLEEITAPGHLDPEAIARVREEFAPGVTCEDELHDALMVCGFLTQAEIERAGWLRMAEMLQLARRAVRLTPNPAAVRPEPVEGWTAAAAAPDSRPCFDGLSTNGNPVGLWVATERLHELRALLPTAQIQGPAAEMHPRPEPEAALRELIRSRLELLGPISAAELAAALGEALRAGIEQALLALEAEGYVMRGAYTAPGVEQWCERRRLARIHRYAREKRRAEFEPVPPAAFLRFLLHWQGLIAGEQREGPAALEQVLGQLEGFPVAAGAWEPEILAARLRDYQPQWLDTLCGSGRYLWQRPRAGGDNGRKAAPVRATPIVLLPREQAALWQAAPDAEPELSSAAQAVLDALRANGASFFVELSADAKLLRSQLEAALGELVSHGLVTCDGYAGLRALVAPAQLKARRLRRGGTGAAFQALEDAGRWSLVRPPRRGAEDAPAAAQIEHLVRVLLRRYGVLFRKLVEREPTLPPWRELFYVLRRLEARGELRGGRFVSGFAGEQFALPEAAGSLRRHREDAGQALVAVAACDPLNLSGLLLPGERIPAVAGNRLLYRGGVPVAALVGGELRWLTEADAATQAAWRLKLTRRGDTEAQSSERAADYADKRG
jgi:ATP-dependent Lhr-like helicase